LEFLTSKGNNYAQLFVAFTISGRDVIKILSKQGFIVTRQKGSHIILVKESKEDKKGVVVPNHKEIDKG